MEGIQSERDQAEATVSESEVVRATAATLIVPIGVAR